MSKQQMKRINLNEEYALSADPLNILLLIQTKDVDTDESIWYADVNVEGLDHNLEIKVSKLLGVLN